MQQSASGLLVPETFPSYSHLGLESTEPDCEEDSVCLWHRQTLNRRRWTETAPSDCGSSANVASNHQAKPALPSHMEDWEGQVQQEVYHRQILLQQQQLLLQPKRQLKQQQQQQQQQQPQHQQQQQQQQQQQSSTTGELLMPLHSYAWRMGLCSLRDESMMGHHLDFLQVCQKPEVLHCIGAAVQLCTRGHSDFRSASAGNTK